MMNLNARKPRTARLAVETLESRVLLDAAPVGPIRSPDNETPYNAAYYGEINESFTSTDVAGRIRVRTPADAARLRNDLVQFVFKQPSLPTAVPQRVAINVAHPLGPRSQFPRGELPNLSRVDRLEHTHEFGFRSSVYLFHPQASSQRLGIWYQGHDYDLGTGGGWEMVAHMLERGFTVLATWMPMYGENEIDEPLNFSPSCVVSPGDSHDSLFCGETATFTPLRFFLEPITLALNHAFAQQSFSDVTMAGLSGGGWATTLYAAIDPRIRLSVPVAGTHPSYLTVRPYEPDKGDWEQFESGLYRFADYLDLYTLGAYGAGRRQIQVFNKFDDCCFAGVRFRTYLDHVKDAVTRLGAGAFDVFLDDAFREEDEDVVRHQLSSHALATAVAPALVGATLQVVDDGENTYWNGGNTNRDVFTSTGTWSELTGLGFGRDARTARGSSDLATATWQFNVRPGRYQIAITWVTGDLDVSEAAPFTVFDGSNLVRRVTINQQRLPGDFRAGGVGWQLLGEFDITGTQLLVRLNSVADAAVVADGVRIAPAGNRDFVARLYRDLLRRQADSGGLDAFAAMINEGQLTRAQAAQVILNSREYRELTVRGLYRDLLRRGADESGLNAFLGLLANGGTAAHIQAAMLGSAEYYRTRGNENAVQFLQAVYNDVLGRTLDPIGWVTFTRMLTSGTSRDEVVRTILNSFETHGITVRALYSRLLGRSPDIGGLNAFINLLQRGSSTEQVMILILGSDEYQRGR